jgi:glycosyltransferase involved in cell wall biosynthesis
MQPSQPLLTIAIPTYNRRKYLEELLICLEPQLAGQHDVELLVSDNASTDDTQEMVEGFRQRGLQIRYIRNEENIGADGNFLQCFRLATGKYLWIFGDDDLLTPKAIGQILFLLRQGEETADFDLVYLSSTSFTGEYKPIPEDLLKDKFGRFAEVVTDGEYFLHKVNGLIILISVVIVNRNRLFEKGFPPIEVLNNTNLLQVGWVFPLLHKQCRILYIWERVLFYRTFNSGGWGIAKVFGLNLNEISTRYFAAEPELARSLMNGVIQTWFMDTLMRMRLGKELGMHQEDFAEITKPVFSGNWRFWVFIYPVAKAPVVIARMIHWVLSRYNRLFRIGQAAYRHVFRRGQLLYPSKQLPIGNEINSASVVSSER